ncbi:MAG: hypothetical protein EAZ37_07250 [Burkholderiales bacterium]|nr:MAG: hypothetical protein EAZ37_07250 [Burkholderiales bacterium]
MPNSIQSQIRAQLQELARAPAVQGCALVEVISGMVWHSAGPWEHMEQQAEAAVEFWRIQDRQAAHFEHLGNLRSSIYFFSAGSVALMPCPGRTPLVLVCIADRVGMDWGQWMQQLKPLHQLLLLDDQATSGAPLS